MRRYFDWLVEHEKLLVCFNLLLIVLLGIQLKFCRSRVAPSTQTSSGFEISADSTKQVPPSVDKSRDSKTNVAGMWDMSVPNKRGAQSWTLELDQHGDDLTGVLNSEGGDLPVTGTIKGQAIKLSATRFGMTVEFTATLSGSTMTGQMHALTIQRAWTAKRR